MKVDPMILEARLNVARTGHVLGYEGEHPLMSADFREMERIAREAPAGSVLFSARLVDGINTELARRRNLLGDAAAPEAR